MKKLILVFLMLCVPSVVFAFQPESWLQKQKAPLANYSRLVSSTSGWMYGFMFDRMQSGNSTWTFHFFDAGTTTTSSNYSAVTAPYIIAPITITKSAYAGVSEPFILTFPLPYAFNNGLCVFIDAQGGTTPYYTIFYKER